MNKKTTGSVSKSTAKKDTVKKSTAKKSAIKKSIVKQGVTQEREYWKPSNMLYPVPAVIVTCRDKKGNDNALTVAWAGTICSDPVMVSISVRKERHSYAMIKETKEFVINLTTVALTKATDYCGVKSGRDVDKFKAMHLTKCESKIVKAPGIVQSPVNLECKVKKIIELGTHDMFIAEVVSTDINPNFIDKKGKLNLRQAGLMAYSHGEYFELGKYIGKFGYSVRKNVK